MVLDAVLGKRVTVAEATEAVVGVQRLDSRDRGLLLKIVLTALRHRGEIDAVIRTHVAKPLPRKSGLAAMILLSAVAQLLFIGSPAHAVIDLSVAAARDDRSARHFSGLINAVLRKIAADAAEPMSLDQDNRINTPSWLWKRWVHQYGEVVARNIAGAHRVEPALDIAVKSDVHLWAERLGGVVLPGNHIRLSDPTGGIATLPGFEAGAWWVQDLAAGIPAMLLGDVHDQRILDLCAAPGGKTMQLCAGGASVTAVDQSEVRLQRLTENLRRTGLSAEIFCEDARNVGQGSMYDSVLLDAPCSATGTIRRHPELPYIKDERSIHDLVPMQSELLAKAASAVRPGGCIVYCTCSLEREEGETQIAGFLAENGGFVPDVEKVVAAGLPPEFVVGPGQVRTLPFMAFGDATGMDGFFVSVLRRMS